MTRTAAARSGTTRPTRRLTTLLDMEYLQGRTRKKGRAARASGGHTFEECVDLRAFPRVEAEVRRPDHARHLGGPPRADDRAGHGRVTQHPGDRDFARRPA